LVIGRLGLGLGLTCLLEPKGVPLALQQLGRAQPLDLGRLAGALLALRLGGQLAADDVLAHVVVLAQREQLADLRRTLRAEAARDRLVSETGDLGGALLDDDQVEH